MKLTRNLKKHLLPVCLVLAFALLLGLTLNLYKPLKQLTQKKVPNPENVLNDDSIIWVDYVAKDGIIYERKPDGSWHIHGKTTTPTGVYLMYNNIPLEAGKTYLLSSGMKNDGVKSYFIELTDSNKIHYLGNLEPEYPGAPSNRIYGAFQAKSGVTYQLNFTFPYAGTVIDEVVYPCLVDGTEARDFYIYK